MKITSIIAYTLVIVGAVVWLLIGLASFDVVAWIFGEMSITSRIIYSLVGVAGLYMIFFACFYKPFKKIA